MAIRSGAGTGVVVGLVVFVLTTVFLLVLTIVFYAGQTKEREARAAAESALANYVKSTERNTDTFKRVEASARANGESVAQYLNRLNERLLEYVSGNPSESLDDLMETFGRYGVSEGENILAAYNRLSRDLSARASEIESLNDRLADLTNDLNKKDGDIENLRTTHQEVVDGFEAQISGYREAAEDYRQRLDDAIAELNRAKDSLRSRYEAEINRLQQENSKQGRQVTTLEGRIQELERQRQVDRLRPQDPATLVDGQIIDAPGSGDEVYINRGREHRVVLGMTFEVYGDPSQIRVNSVTGEFPRGKASLQVTRVADTTSTCRITRSVPGQPVVRGDVLANAVYDPNYKFKFLVHGKFDIDRDGRPTETEAEYLRSLIVDWGGTVVTGEELSGDLDFLVLGEEPPLPPPPPPGAGAVLLDDHIRKRDIRQTYLNLLDQATAAQIPVLNANRFFILIGHTDR